MAIGPPLKPFWTAVALHLKPVWQVVQLISFAACLVQALLLQHLAKPKREVSLTRAQKLPMLLRVAAQKLVLLPRAAVQKQVRLLRAAALTRLLPAARPHQEQTRPHAKRLAAAQRHQQPGLLDPAGPQAYLQMPVRSVWGHFQLQSN